MNLAPQSHQIPVKRTNTESPLEKGRKFEPFDGGRVTGDQRSVTRARRMDSKR